MRSDGVKYGRIAARNTEGMRTSWCMLPVELPIVKACLPASDSKWRHSKRRAGEETRHHVFRSVCAFLLYSAKPYRALNQIQHCEERREMKRFPSGIAALVAVAVILTNASAPSAQTLRRRDAPDYSAEPFVVERISGQVSFNSDGTYVVQSSVRVHIQSSAGLQAFGLLRIPYASANSDVEFANVKVTKPNGTVVTTAQDGVQDMPAQITVAAPFYSDRKEKQLAVRGLEVGDTLEYEHIDRVRSPFIPGQFWFAYNFLKAGIVLSEEVTIQVPAGRTVKVKSAKVQPTTTDAGGYRVYTWKTANLVSPKTNDPETNQAAADTPVADLQLSSFSSWAEIADWYEQLQEPRIEPTPEIRAKAAELTRGASSDDEKIRALYNYVALKFRYIGIDFGIGRYQPHAATEVLANGYGDCKDKHTLLAALLAATGIKSYPVLINSGHRIDADVPSPSQFDHVITVVPRGDDFVWLDTTPEVAPFGLLMPNLRDKEALVVSGTSSKLVKSPANPPFRSSFAFQMNGKIGDDGTLDAKAEVAMRGDAEVAFRSAFRSTSQNQWKDVMQVISQSLSFAGTVSNVNVSSPEATEDAFNLKYAYNRKNYPHWPDGIGFPLPPINLAELPEEQAKISEPIPLEAPGEYQLDSAVELPAGVTPRLRPAIDIKKDFAEYHAEYSIESNVLRAKRRLVIQLREIPKSRSEEYRAFWKAVKDDGETVLSLVSAAPANAAAAGGSPAASSSAADQVDLGNTLYNQKDYDGAIAQYRKALQLEPDNSSTHLSIGDALYNKDDYDGALVEYREAARLRPADAHARSSIGDALFGKKDYEGAATAYRESLGLKADEPAVHSSLADVLAAQNDWDGALAEYRAVLRLDPKSFDAQKGAGDMLYNKGDLRGAVAAYQELVRLKPEDAEAHGLLGNALYRTRDYDGAIAEAREAMRLNPSETHYHEGIGQMLAAKGDYDGAIAEYRESVRANPGDPDTGKYAETRIGEILIREKRLTDAVAELQPVIEKYPEDAGLRLVLGTAEVRSGQMDQARAAFAKGLELAPSAGALNNIAYELADDNALLDDAQRYGQEAVGQVAGLTANIDIGALKIADLRLMGSLAGFWDTLGWVYFRQGQTAQAEKFLGAAWKLEQAAVMGDHLGQVYEKAGDKQQAAHYYALTLALPGAAGGSSPVRSRLEALVGSPAKADQAIRDARGELGDSRTVKLPRVVRGAAKAEFFVLFTPDGGATGVRFISGSEELHSAGDAIVAAHYDVAFPDKNPAKIVRRGILDCPATGTNCQFVLLPPESVTSMN